MAKKIARAKRPALKPQVTPVLPTGTDPSTGFRIPPPAGMRPRGVVLGHALAEETGQFSNTGTTGQMKRTGGGYASSEAINAAQRRMRGLRETPDPEPPADLDELGETGLDDEGGREQDEQDEQDDEQALDDDRPAPVAEQTTRARQHAVESTQFSDQQVFGRHEPVAPPRELQPGFYLRTPVIEDTDRLWDWVRLDTDRGEMFFGRPLTNTKALHDLVRGVLLQEAKGTALARSIYYLDADHVAHHVGMIFLMPILSTERAALVSLYLRQDVRANVRNFLHVILAEAKTLVPEYHLTWFTRGEAQTKAIGALLQPLGFTPCTMFVL